MLAYGREGAIHGLDSPIGQEAVMLERNGLHFVLYDTNEQYAVTWRMAIGVLSLVEYCNRRGFTEEFVAEVEMGNLEVDKLAKVALFSERPPSGDV